ncbi:MAG: hypothetical protein NUV81_01455 [bacterium]|nr:hypothetical protein [bacterium]
MMRPSTTSATFLTYVRVIILLIFSILFVRTVPFLTEQTDFFQFFSNQVVNMGILYAIIVGFLMTITLKRKQALDEFVSQELNKIRRMYHLSKNIALDNPKLNKWFSEIRSALTEYSKLFCEHDFDSYDLGNPLFRKVTYSIYSLPREQSTYNKELYVSLLTATEAATESREYIRSKRDQMIGMYQWIVISVVTGTLSAILITSTPDDMISRIVTTAVVFNLFLVLLLIYEYDTPSHKINRVYASYYAHNLDDIDPCPVRPKKRRLKRKG